MFVHHLCIDPGERERRVQTRERPSGPSSPKIVNELVVVVFRDQFRAPEVLNELRRRDWSWIRDLDEAVAVTINDDGKARVHLSVDLSNGEAASWARMWSSLLRTTLFLPLTEVMAEAADAISAEPALRAGCVTESSSETSTTRCWQGSLNLSGDFKRDVAASIEPGGSAIFMMLRTAGVPVALDQLRNYGGIIVHTPANVEQDESTLRELVHEQGSKT